MAPKPPLSALRLAQRIVRAVQLIASLLLLAFALYFIIAMQNHGISSPTSTRAVAGISGIAAFFTLGHSFLLRVIVGRTLTSFLAIVLDVAFAASFIYVAVASRGGAGSCNGDVNTPFGQGDADAKVDDGGHGGFVVLPKFGQACQLLSASLAIAIILIFLFLLSATIELQLGRSHQRNKRLITASGALPVDDPLNPEKPDRPKSRFRNYFSRKKSVHQTDTENFLPAHPGPDQIAQSPVRPNSYDAPGSPTAPVAAATTAQYYADQHQNTQPHNRWDESTRYDYNDTPQWEEVQISGSHSNTYSRPYAPDSYLAVSQPSPSPQPPHPHQPTLSPAPYSPTHQPTNTLPSPLSPETQPFHWAPNSHPQPHPQSQFQPQQIPELDASPPPYPPSLHAEHPDLFPSRFSSVNGRGPRGAYAPVPGSGSSGTGYDEIGYRGVYDR